MRVRSFAFPSEHLTLEGELILPETPRGLVLLLHGIPGGGPPDPEDPGYPGLARAVAQRDWATAWFNFRGCRGAPGEFSIAGWHHDVNAALDALGDVPDLRGLARVVVGSSAGGSTAIAVCGERDDVTAVATMAAPASFGFGGLTEDPAALVQRFRNIGIIRDPAFPPDLEAWIKEFSDLAPEEAVARLAPRSVLIMHGTADDVVPYEHAERLFAAAREPKEIVRFPAGGHQLRRDERAVDALGDWLEHTVGRMVRSVHSPDHSK